MELSEAYRIKAQAEAVIATFLKALVETTGRKILVLHVHEGLDDNGHFTGLVSGTGIVFNDNLAGIMSGDFIPPREDVRGECPYCEEGNVIRSTQDPCEPPRAECDVCQGTNSVPVCYECKGPVLDEEEHLCTGCQEIIEAELERKS